MASPRRTRKKKKSILPVLLAGVLVLGGGAYYYMSSMEDPAVVAKRPERPEGKVAVPVANKDLSRGKELTDREITLKYLFPDEVPEDVVINPKLFRGRWLVNALGKGDFIREQDLAREGASKGYSGMLKPGRRIAIIPTKGITGTTGYLQVGDIVDIYSTGQAKAPPPKAGSPATTGSQPGQKPKPKAKNTDPGTLPVARLIVAGAEVVSVPRSTRTGDKENVVLEVDDKDSIKLMLAQANSEILQFIYRPFGEKDTDLPTYVQADRDPRVIEVIKGVKSKNVMTKLH